MRQFMMMMIGGGVVVATVGFGVFLVLRAFYTMFADWLEQRELAKISAHAKAQRGQRKAKNEQRLDTGCDHVFEGVAAGLPPGVCHKCGIERDKPSGMCDHQWKRDEGSTPGSQCTKCGKQYRAAPMPQGFGG